MASNYLSCIVYGYSYGYIDGLHRVSLLRGFPSLVASELVDAFGSTDQEKSVLTLIERRSLSPLVRPSASRSRFRGRRYPAMAGSRL